MSAARRLPTPTTLPETAVDFLGVVHRLLPDLSAKPEVLDDYAPAIRGLHAMSLLAAEVGNGGFSQFFFNGGGVWVDDAIAGLEAAGLSDYRDLTRQAADAVVAQIGLLRDAQRGGSIETYASWDQDSDLDRFDDRWFGLPDIDAALDRFLIDHADEIWEPA